MSRFFQAGRAGARGGREAARRRTTAPCCTEKRDALDPQQNPSFPQVFGKEPRTACLTREAERPRGSPKDRHPSAAAPGEGSSSVASPNAALGTPARATGSPDRGRAASERRVLHVPCAREPSAVGTRPTAGLRGRLSPAPHCEESGRPRELRCPCPVARWTQRTLRPTCETRTDPLVLLLPPPESAPASNQRVP